MGLSQLRGYATAQWLVTGFPPLQNGFDLRSGHVTLVVDKMVMGKFPPSTSISLAIIIPWTAPHSLIILSLIIYSLNTDSVENNRRKEKFSVAQII
jgi:hypothetical protein